MKKVRFESPNKLYVFKMNDSECHSPRPFMERERSTPPIFMPDSPRVLTFTNDPVQRYEISNSSPYPAVNRTEVACLSKEPYWKPSDDLNLSLLDACSHEPRNPRFCKSILKENILSTNDCVNTINVSEERPPLTEKVTYSNTDEPPNVLVKDNSFFIKRDNLNKYNFSTNPLQSQMSKLNLGKENDPMAKKIEMMSVGNDKLMNTVQTISPVSTSSDECRCHNCIKSIGCLDFNNHHHYNSPLLKDKQQIQQITHRSEQNCECLTPRNNMCHSCHIPPPIPKNVCKTCNCHNPGSSPAPQNAVDRKTWTIEKYEQSTQPCMEVEKQKNVKEKREPTVADLFKIIKLQNEQLQLLQEKVDKFMSSQQNVRPTITCSTEHVSVNAVENTNSKMSVGVMTSFEMIRTSTVINKEVVRQNEAQIQCNRSQISIKEVLKPVNMNFLDGIVPKNSEQSNEAVINNGKCTENAGEEKTLNEQSLFNLQVDNVTTPLISPEQTLYLDVRDYSDSDASSSDQSNVGWTYYNKVMTHVNGMLQDSEMPSSASAMYRNTRQHCLMHIDTTNVSVTKRVKFGDDPLGLHQPHIYAPTTDTSLKMNQLAAKYLNTPRARPANVVNVQAPAIDMSFATRNYMEKHRILQGLPAPTKSPQVGEIPRFLDITALKQQPKFL